MPNVRWGGGTRTWSDLSALCRDGSPVGNELCDVEVAASALANGAAAVITNDRRVPRVPGLRVVGLTER